MTYAAASSLEAVTWAEAFVSIFTNFKLLFCPFYRLGALVRIGAYTVIYSTAHIIKMAELVGQCDLRRDPLAQAMCDASSTITLKQPRAKYRVQTEVLFHRYQERELAKYEQFGKNVSRTAKKCGVLRSFIQDWVKCLEEFESMKKDKKERTSISTTLVTFTHWHVYTPGYTRIW